LINLAIDALIEADSTFKTGHATYI